MSELTCMLVGAGIRGLQYVDHASSCDPDFKPVAVAEPDDQRRNDFADRFGIPPERRFQTWQEAASHERMADCVINATRDHLHHASAVALLQHGYDMLLEKPIAPCREETLEIADTARGHGCKVMICHVLRYTPFYSKVKEILESGRLGRIMEIRMAENVSWHHFATGFVRGRFRNIKEGAPFILAKCCHDTDLMAWFMSGNPPRRVSSFGSLTYFRPENAPEGAADNCYDCPHLETCPFSAERIYVKGKIWRFRALTDFTGTSDEEAREALRRGPYSRCVWRCDNDVVDKQTLSVEFADGAIGTMNTSGVAARPDREIAVYGTKGELRGSLEDGKLIVREIEGPGGKYREELIDPKGGSGHELDGHGGGDSRLVADFIDVLRGKGTNRTCIEDSIYGHLIGYAAEDSRAKREWITVDCLPT
ncbi:MAG: Gfo/Idh/MocA family oxidoreductase [Planctomycetota bacterium]|nr:Gfo/Idh/MocA family oxidoreductase [Planctomycetota bacterium]